MKEFKIIAAIIITFFTAFSTSVLLEITFINSNWIRYSLVVLIILLELIIGFMYIKSEIPKLKNP